MLVSEKFEVSLIGTHGLEVPMAQAEPFMKAGHSRVAIKAFFEDRSIDFHGKLHKNQGRIMISFGKRYQKELGVDASDFFHLQLFENKTKYGVEMPEEFEAVLESDPEAMEGFEKLTDGKKRSLIYYVLRFKSSQTRIDKALIISENIKMGITDQKELTKDRR
ncbi:MAG: YdeI/OmpD-associated family protein [Flavobacteriaceae bacterium]|nr:YdeI/OmpD-associated family protein [Flavobacteriaceae bacterium]